jgi:hypothetical protein
MVTVSCFLRGKQENSIEVTTDSGSGTGHPNVRDLKRKLQSMLTDTLVNVGFDTNGSEMIIALPIASTLLVFCDGGDDGVQLRDDQPIVKSNMYSVYEQFDTVPANFSLLRRVRAGNPIHPAVVSSTATDFSAVSPLMCAANLQFGVVSSKEERARTGTAKQSSAIKYFLNEV